METVKKLVLRFLNSRGYNLVKVPPRFEKSNTEVEMIVGGRTIKTHAGSPLRQVYQQNPECNRALAIAAKLVQEKYPAAWAVDVGANVGDTLCVMRSQTNLPVICVEGDPHCYALLQQNAQQFDSVHLLNVFLSNASGTAAVSVEKEGWNTTLSNARNSKSSRTVKFDTLDTVASGLQCRDRIKLLKVDAEGYDMRILKGSAAILAACHPVVLFELNQENVAPLGDSVSDFLAFLRKLNYDQFHLADPDGRPVCNLNAEDERVFSSLYHYSGPGKTVCFFDVCAFHKDDADLFEKFLNECS